MNPTTTLKALRQERACIRGYNRLVRALQGREFTEADEDRNTYIWFAHAEAIPLSLILNSNNLDDALWALRACEQTPELRRAERRFGVWCARQVQHLMQDPRSPAARDAARASVMAAAQGAAAWDAARGAARASVMAAAWDAWGAARASVMASVMAAARDAIASQKVKFIEMFCS